MGLIDLLIAEFEHEARTTRPHLERLPGDQLNWRPAGSRFTARVLASYIVDCVGLADAIFGKSELDVEPAAYKPSLATSIDELLKTFDDKVADCRRVLAGATDADLLQPWRLKMRGHVRFEKPRAAVFRDFTLSHVIHHRGQLSVYLRLLDVPVPSPYGPTADEKA